MFAGHLDHGFSKPGACWRPPVRPGMWGEVGRGSSGSSRAAAAQPCREGGAVHVTETLFAARRLVCLEVLWSKRASESFEEAAGASA